tara:strand:+ start:231 stop:935 length:705 start_codon:yes stop_codon:yes gene_type:complete
MGIGNPRHGPTRVVRLPYDPASFGRCCNGGYHLNGIAMNLFHARFFLLRIKKNGRRGQSQSRFDSSYLVLSSRGVAEETKQMVQSEGMDPHAYSCLDPSGGVAKLEHSRRVSAVAPVHIPFPSMQLPVQQRSVVPLSKMAEKIIFVGATPFWASHGGRSDQRERPIIVRYSTDDSVVQRPRQDRIAEMPPPPSLQRHDRVAKEGPYVVQEDFRQQTMQHVHRYHIDLHGCINFQ